MSNENKTRLEVQKLLRDTILHGLTELRLQDGTTPWDCMEFGQATFAKADKIVTMNYSRTNVVGWQGKTFNPQGHSATEDWIEEQTWQLQVILKRKTETSSDSVLAEDVATMLILWFNGRGCDYLRQFGVSCLRIDSNDIIVYNDDSLVYQKRAVFSIKVLINKNFTYVQDFMTNMIPGTFTV